MHKPSLWARILQRRLSTCAVIIISLLAFINFYVFYGQYYYSSLPRENIEKQLYKETSLKLTLKKSSKIKDCKYDDILESKHGIQIWEIPDKFDDFPLDKVVNGSFTPDDCRPLFSVAILVTYRDRQSNWDIFLPYMHNFLMKQRIHYCIYLIEQQDKKPWNKGVLYNLGAKQAIADGFPCLILHDVDLIPLDDANLYVCTEQPRHLSASIDKMRYVLPYKTLVGGVLAIRSDQYTKINGFSNRFNFWGGEDDDFSHRLKEHNLEIWRFPREMSSYTMLKHVPGRANVDRRRIMDENVRLHHQGGLDTVHYKSVQVSRQRLYTLVGVKL